jgi:hypothetical protein
MLRKSRIEDTITNNTSGFLDTTFCIEVTLDGVFSMSYLVNTFKPLTPTLLQSYRRGQDGSLQDIWSAPIGIMGLSLSDVKRKIQRYLYKVLEGSATKASLSAEPGEEFPAKVLNILLRFGQNASDDLVCLFCKFPHCYCANIPV